MMHLNLLLLLQINIVCVKMKIKYRITLVFILLGILNVTSAQCWLEDKITGKKFKIFNALLYKDLPNMQDMCIQDINVVYAWKFFPRGHKKNPYAMPSNDAINKVANNAKKQDLLTVIDIEHWGLKNKNDAEKSVKNYTDVVKQLKKQLPELKIGYYGVVPIVDFSRAKSDVVKSKYMSWVKDNNRVKPIANIVDAAFPSLYTINSNSKSWLSRAKAHIGEARRLAKNKPVYPFVWPNYHRQGGRYPKGYEVEKKYWRLQLEFLRKNADGIVLWGGYKQTFNSRMEWWRETQEFLKDSFFLKTEENK